MNNDIINELEKWLEEKKISSFEAGIKYENVMPYFVGIQETIEKLKEILKGEFK